jgi:hypothetical protein
LFRILSLIVFFMTLLKYSISAVCMFCFCFSVITQDYSAYGGPKNTQLSLSNWHEQELSNQAPCCMEQREGSPFTMPIPNTLEIYWITRTLRELMYIQLTNMSVKMFLKYH